MTAIKEDRQHLKLYKKSDIYRTEGMVVRDFDKRKCDFIPIEYTSPHTRLRVEGGASTRYIKVSELKEYLENNDCNLFD